MKTTAILRLCLGALFATVAWTTAHADDDWQKYLGEVRIKQAIADKLTPEQLEERRERLARWLSQRANTPRLTEKTGADACPATTHEIGSLPFSPPPGTTVGMVDNYDLPADVTNPTCSAPTMCTGNGVAGSLPRGAIYTGTGTAPDFAYRIRTSANCSLTITMDPTATQDMTLVVYENQCSSNLADCNCVADAGGGGGAETVVLQAVAGTDYFVSVDGYSTGATPPGPSGPYTLSISGAGCSLVGTSPPADLELAITDSPDPVNAGDDITYVLTSSNTDTGAADNVTITTTTPANTTFVSATPSSGTCATLPPAGGTGAIECAFAGSIANGASQTVTLVLAVDEATPDATIITLNASTASTSLESDGANNAATAQTTVVAQADLEVALTATPDPVTAGDTVTFAATVTNNGPLAAADATYELPLPTDSEFVSITNDPAFACTTPAVGADGLVSCVATNVPSGTSLTVDVDVDVPGSATGTFDATATVSGSTADSATGNNTSLASTNIVASADIDVTLDGAPDPVVAGDAVVFTSLVSNNGPSNATSVAYDLPVPAGTAYASFTADPPFLCTTPAVGATTGSVNCTATNLTATSSAAIDVTFDVLPGSIGTVGATATVTSGSTDPTTANDVASDSVSVSVVAALSISVDNGRNGVRPDEEVVYQVQVDNAGPSDAVDALVGVTLSALLGDVEWTCVPSPDAACPNASGTGNVSETVDIGASEGLLYEVVATVSAEGGKPSVSAAATVAAASGTTDPDTSDNSDTDTDPVLPDGIFSDGFES